MAGEVVGFTRMDRSVKRDWEIVAASEAEHCRGSLDRLLDLFRRCDTVSFAHRVTSYVHGRQTATRALRDGADDEMVAVALLHDMGEVISAENHSEVSAALLRPYISEENYWLVRHHSVFQGYYYLHHLGRDRNARERWRGHPAFAKTAAFCERWDQCSFDPDYDTLPLAAFEPMLRRVFAHGPREV